MFPAMSRRSVLKGAGAFLTAPAVLRSARAQSRELLVYAWYPVPLQAMFKDFTEQTGIPVRFVGSYGGNPVWWSKMLAGEVWDVFLPSMDWMTRAALADKIEPLDLARIPNVANLSAAGHRAVDEELTVNGKVYALPWALTINCIAYNTKRVADAKVGEGWDLMWDPELAGKISTKDEALIPVLTAAIRLGIPTDDIAKWTPAQFTAIRASLLEQKKLIRKYWSNHEELAEMLVTEQVLAGQWTDGRSRLLASQGQPVAMLIPAAGAPAVIDTIAIHKAAPNKAEAHEFINFALRPEQLIKISKLHGAIVMSDRANALLPEAERASFAIDPAWKFHWRRFTSPEAMQRVERTWTEVKLARA